MKDYSVLEGLGRNFINELRCAYDRGYRHGCDDEWAETQAKTKEEEGYKRGLESAWSCAKRIMSMPLSDQEKIFNMQDERTIMDAHSAEEAIDILKRYDEKHYDLPKNEEINIGDEIICNGVNIKAVVFKILDNTHYKCFSLEHGVTTEEGVVKTGRRFPEMVELIERMKNE